MSWVDVKAWNDQHLERMGLLMAGIANLYTPMTYRHCARCECERVVRGWWCPVCRERL